MRTIEEQKTHYDKLLEKLKQLYEKYEKHKGHPEDFVNFSREGLGELEEGKDQTAYNWLIKEISVLYYEAKN